MKSSSWHSLFGWLAMGVMLMILAAAGPARADGKIAAMGVRSLDGEDELERKLSTSLRAAAGTLSGYSVTDREQSLEQMSLAYGCEEPDARCLSEIARALSVDHLVYGTVVGGPSGHELTLHLYSVSPVFMESTSVRGVTAAQLTGPTSKDTLAALLRRLFGEDKEPSRPATGILSVSGPPGGVVLIDAESAGTLDNAGSLRVQLAPGRHTVRLAGPSASKAEAQVAQVEAGGESELALATPRAVVDELPTQAVDDTEPVPAQKPRRSLRKILGWTAVGIGAAFAIATVYSWVRIEKINDDPNYLAYRAAYPRANLTNGVSNVCSRAKRGQLAESMPDQADLERSARNLCNEADRLETLQYVFLGGTVLGAGVGTYLLLTADREPRATVRLSPRFDAQSASMAATLTF